MFGLGHWEIIIILVFALLIFGRRLPEVARSLGKGIVEFKKGVRGIEDEVDQNAGQTSQNASLPPPAPRTEAGGFPTSNIPGAPAPEPENEKRKDGTPDQ